MRPVNLIPAEDRRGDKAPLRTGAFAYVLVSGLGLLLLAVVVTALTSKQISDRESEKQTLEQELADVTAQADSLRAFSDFRLMQESRTSTVSSLAQSRFDWERVMNELSLILPDDIWLIKLTGTVSPAIQLQDGAEIPTRESVAGPALELVGCAPDQDAVAGFVATLEDIDGVTRVGVSSAERPEQQDGEPAAAAPTGGGGSEAADDDCRTTDEIVKFEIVVAFDAVPVPAAATATLPVPAPTAPSGDGEQLTDAQTEQAPQQASTNAQTAKAEQAQENLVPGG
jgi:Tfp pilus assembly protein PilN